MFQVAACSAERVSGAAALFKVIVSSSLDFFDCNVVFVLSSNKTRTHTQSRVYHRPLAKIAQVFLAMLGDAQQILEAMEAKSGYDKLNMQAVASQHKQHLRIPMKATNPNFKCPPGVIETCLDASIELDKYMAIIIDHERAKPLHKPGTGK